MSKQDRWPLPPRADADLPGLSPGELEDDETWAQVEVSGDLTGQSTRGLDVVEARLVGARFAGAELERVRFTDTVVDDCDLSGTVFHHASFDRVEVRRSRMSGAVLAGATFRDVRFVDCRLDEANVRMVRGERVAFEDTVLSGSDFYEAKLVPSRMFDCDLGRANFDRADLRGARLHGSKLDGIKGAEALREAVVDSTQVLPLALAVFAALGIVVDDDREPPDVPKPGRPRERLGR